MQKHKNIKKFSKYLSEFEKKGFVLVKNFFKKKSCEKAARWLKFKNQKKLAKSWTEQEPAVPLAVYFAIHRNDTPISKLAKNKSLLNFASKLINDKVYIWSSKVNLKVAWCGTAEYYHQDMVYWKDRGYLKDKMMSAMIILESHKINNAALHVFPGTHKLGFIKHEPFININGLAKFMISPKNLDKFKKKFGVKVVEAEPGDVLFFHASLVHGSGHNISSDGRMVILSQLNTKNNLPKNVNKKAILFNLSRAKKEYKEAKRRMKWFKKKYITQLKSNKLTFHAPIVKEEKY
jgi:ectoine hydroxylase|tara:strand:+ start:98 stop:970 length:873 start_codon:yes stop_codon:yes gene_type:complete